MDITGIIVRIIDKFENDRNLIEEFTAVGAPKLIYNGADDKYQPIMASEFQFNLMVNDKTDGKFFHLYTGNEKRYLVAVGDQDNNLLFEGYLLPDFYSEPYDNGVIFVDLTATDGLGLLKGNYLPNSYYKQENSVIKIIAECLRFTQLDKNIVFAPAIESAATDYRWDEIAVNGATYLDGDIEYIFMVGEVMPKRKNAYEILELLLESLGCTLYGQGDTWYIEGINRKHEESQFIYNYDKNGVFQNTETVTKNVVDLVFFKTPTVSIVSPWKRVDVEWDCDEDGNLIPDYAIQDKTTTDGIEIVPFTPKDMFSFWKINGALNFSSLNRESKIRYVLSSYLGLSIIEGFIKPLHLEVLRRINILPSPADSENETDYVNNYFSILKRKYLKISDEYIDRSIDFKISLESNSRIESDGVTPVVDSVDEKEFSISYKYDVIVGSNIIVSSKLDESDERSNRLTCKKVSASSDYNSQITIGDYFTAKLVSVSADLELKELVYTQNGFFDIRLHAPLSADSTQPWYYGYVVKTLNIQVTELKKWEDSLTRNIDFTTTKDVTIFHGDSIGDLTEKQFRFRRPIYGSVGGYGAIEIISYEQLFPLQPWFYHYFISYEAYTAISENPSLFYVTYGGNQIAMNDLSSSTSEAWSLVASWSGLYYIQINSQLIDHPSGIGINITDFLNLSVGESDVYVIGYETEDNEWRESWKRYGQTESIRYGLAIGKIYHDVQPEALVKVEGSAIGCLFPREIGRFLWRDLKKFIPTRTTIDFSKGRTEVLILESSHEIVTDYVD